MRAKNLFWSKNRERPSLCLSVKSSIRRNITIAVRVTENVFFDAVFREVVIIVAVWVMFHPRRQREACTNVKLEFGRRNFDGCCLAIKCKDLITLVSVVSGQVFGPWASKQWVWQQVNAAVWRSCHTNTTHYRTTASVAASHTSSSASLLSQTFWPDFQPYLQSITALWSNSTQLYCMGVVNNFPCFCQLLVTRVMCPRTLMCLYQAALLLLLLLVLVLQQLLWLRSLPYTNQHTYTGLFTLYAFTGTSTEKQSKGQWRPFPSVTVHAQKNVRKIMAIKILLIRWV